MRDRENILFYRRLAYLAAPIIIQDFLNAFVNILDTFMVGTLGVAEITAVGLSNQVFFLFNLLGFGVASGSSILMGQFWGGGDKKSVHKTMGVCLAGCLAAALLFSCVALFAPRAVMGFYSADGAVIAIGAEYLRIVWVSYILTAISMTINISLKSVGRTVLPMATSIAALATNLTANYLFLFVFRKGIPGVAMATVIARAVELCLQLILVVARKTPVVGKFKNYFSADAAFVKKYLRLVTPVVLNEFAWALGTSVYNAAYKYCGTEAQGALQISGSVHTMFMVFGMGVGSACSIILANTLGEGDSARAVRYSRKILLLAAIISAATGALLAASFPFVISLFNVPETVRFYAFRIILVMSAALVFKNLNFTAIVGILRSGGDTLFCFLLDMSSVWLIGVPMAFIGAAALGLPVYWVVAMVNAEELFKLTVVGRRVFKNKWANRLI